MVPRGWRGRPSPEWVVASVLGGAFAVVTLLLAQSLAVSRDHELMLEATLTDFAAFASQRIAAELDSEFSAIFLDQIAIARSVHYAWIAGADDEGRPEAEHPVPEGAIPFHFSIDEGELITRGGEAGAEDEAWILEQVAAHASRIYPRPAPYAVLRPGDPGLPTVVYRKEQAYERVSIYGFVVRFDRFTRVYTRMLDDLDILPPSLAEHADRADLLTVSLVFPQWPTALFTADGPRLDRSISAEAFAAKAGRMAVRVEMDVARARALLPGAFRRLGVPQLAALAVLGLGLFAAALLLLRRASRLHRMREAFVANASHDLRTPLAQIRMFTETLLLERLSRPEERRRSLEIIGQQASNLSDLVDNVVLASGQGRIEIRPGPVDLGTVLQDTVDALGPAARERGSGIRAEISGPEQARVDSAALRRILVNLIDNALKYGPRGQTVTVRLDSRPGFVDVVVDDQGDGVPVEERRRVWDRFTRLERDGRSVTGTGIGLAVVRDLAERHGGAVRIEEAPGGGARVTASLAA